MDAIARSREGLARPAVGIDDWKELASRAGDGLEISLLWSRSADRVKVTVCDARFEERFDIDVANEEALAAFYHPFAYAHTVGSCAQPEEHVQRVIAFSNHALLDDR